MTNPFLVSVTEVSLFISLSKLSFCDVNITLLLVNLFSVWNQLILKHKEKEFYTQELSKLKEEEEYLNMEVEKLKDPDYVARYAREQFLYSKDGEFNIRIK